MKTMVSGDMIGETLRGPADPGILQRPALDFHAQTILRVPARTAATAVQAPEAAGEPITEHCHLARARSTFQVQPDASPAARYDRRDPSGRRPVSFPPDRALQTASRALRVLEEIADDDRHFEMALGKIQTWLDERRLAK